MSWTTPTAWATNEIVSASKWNREVRDNQTFLHSPAYTRVFSQGAQQLRPGVWTDVHFQRTQVDTHGMLSDLQILRVLISGAYLVCASIAFSRDTNARIASVGAGISTAANIAASSVLTFHRAEVASSGQSDSEAIVFLAPVAIVLAAQDQYLGAQAHLGFNDLSLVDGWSHESAIWIGAGV